MVTVKEISDAYQTRYELYWYVATVVQRSVISFHFRRRLPAASLLRAAGTRSPLFYANTWIALGSFQPHLPLLTPTIIAISCFPGTQSLAWVLRRHPERQGI